MGRTGDKMRADFRADVAKYYDMQQYSFDDVSFYKLHINPESRVLELGCGTGRVLLPLIECCGYIEGVDHSEGMLKICGDKLEAAGIPPSKARIGAADITNFDLGSRFDLITAPFRVIQNLETDAQFDGLFRCIRKHLAPDGECILNVFKPFSDRETLIKTWCRQEETFTRETPIEGGKVTQHDTRPRLDPETMVLYPELIYRLWQGNTVVDKQVLKIPMKCFWPEEFTELITSHGFTVTDKWGGYNGEPYGEGSELVVKFKDGQ